MIKRVVMWLVLVPFGLLLAIFALANRHIVQIGIDPISPQTPFWGPMELPLFVVIYAALLLGVILGGVGSWLEQGKHRRAERQLRRDLNKAQREAAPEKAAKAEDPLALLENDNR
ncbi:LapA family protein [Maritalea porphyrae]|uniref:LapA family protein n=1 Tax=Maritalea porphyrae TaxID=880732 RepID=UPI0022AFC9AC|nr:LapA family protein [Maritalea porphyrae]MCZ4271992.1 LapA family protein [Maritalea porphyrae]